MRRGDNQSRERGAWTFSIFFNNNNNTALDYFYIKGSFQPSPSLPGGVLVQKGGFDNNLPPSSTPRSLFFSRENSPESDKYPPPFG